MRRAWESLGKLGNITDHGVSQGFLRCHEGSLPVTSYHYLSQAINRQGPFPRLHQVSLHFLTPRYIPFLSSRLPFLRIPDVSRHRLEHLFQVIGRVPHLGCDRPTIGPFTTISTCCRFGNRTRAASMSSSAPSPNNSVSRRCTWRGSACASDLRHQTGSVRVHRAEGGAKAIVATVKGVTELTWIVLVQPDNGPQDESGVEVDQN